MDLGLEALQPWDSWRPLIYCDTLWILSEVLEVYFKALGYIVYVQVLLWTQKGSLCNEDLAQSIECLIAIGNVVPWLPYVQKSKEWEFQVD